MICTFTELFTKDKKDEKPKTPTEIEMKKEMKKMEIGNKDDPERA